MSKRESQSVPVVLKFGEEPHMRDLLSRGIVYMQRLDMFRKGDPSNPRFDPNEGADLVGQPGRVTVRLNGYPFEISEPSFLWWGGEAPPHVFCAYSISHERAVRAKTETPTQPIVDARNGSKDTAVLIMDVPAFQHRLRSAIERMGLEYGAGLVEYMPADYQGPLGPFRKMARFDFECEVRFAACRHPGEKPLIVTINSIEDIAHFVPADEACRLEVELGEVDE